MSAKSSGRNSNLKKIKVLLRIITGELKFQETVLEAMKMAGTPTSKSKIHGWQVSSGNKNYREMSDQEFDEVLAALILYYEELNVG